MNTKQRSPDIFHKLWVLGDRHGNEWSADEARSWYTGGNDSVSAGKKSHPWLLKTYISLLTLSDCTYILI
jgi:hypothetical protein